MPHAREPVLAGEIPNGGVLSLLREVESLRTTGVLRFEHGDVKGEVVLIAGQIADDQKELPDGRDPVEALLELCSGSYEVWQRLPPLPVSKGDDVSRTGSLAVHVPADLMNYCEHAGLTGTLALENEGRRAEVLYDRGELVAIRVEGTEEEDLHEVFGWEEGTFHIRAHSRPPPVDLPASGGALGEGAEEPGPEEAPRRRDETGQQFLQSVEVALARILEEREKRRSPTRTSPPLPPAPRARASDSLPGLEGSPADEPPKKEREPTVRIIYLGPRERGDSDRGLRHVSSEAPADEALPDTSPERRARGDREPVTTLVGTLGWVLVVLVLLVAALAVLARLPPIE